MFPLLTTMSPFIYTAMILYPFLFGYGLFRKTERGNDEKYIVFIDFHKTNPSTNIYYTENTFSLKTEIDFELDYEETEQLNLFTESEIPYKEIHSYMNEFMKFWKGIVKKYNYEGCLYFVISSNVFSYLTEEMLEEYTDSIKLVDMIDSYGNTHIYESDIPLMSDNEKREEKTHSRFLYTKVLAVYDSFPDCYVN